MLRKDKLVPLVDSANLKNLEHSIIDVLNLDEDEGDLAALLYQCKEVCAADLGDSGGLFVRPDRIMAYRFLHDAILRSFDVKT